MLFTGDVVMDQFPMPISPTSSIRRWLVALDELEEFGATLIVPSHYSTGSGEMIVAYRDYFTTVQSRVNALATEGMTAQEAGAILRVELAAKFGTWSDPDRIQRSIGAAFRERQQTP